MSLAPHHSMNLRGLVQDEAFVPLLGDALEGQFERPIGQVHFWLARLLPYITITKQKILTHRTQNYC